MLDQQQSDRVGQLIREAMQADQEGEPEKAKQLYRECIAIDDGAAPPEVGALGVSYASLRYATLLKNDGDYEQAIRVGARALADRKWKSYALHVIGICHIALGQFDDAEKAFREGLALVDQPERQAWFSILLGCVTGKDEARHAETRQWFGKAVELAPNNDEAHYNLGVALSVERDFRGAQVQLQQAIALDPNYAIAYAYLGDALMELGDDDTARIHLEKAIEIDPRIGFAHATIGRLLLRSVYGATDTDQRNQYARACEDHLRRSMELDPSYEQSWVFLVNLYWLCGRLRKANEEAKKLLQLFPRSSAAHWVVGDFLASTGPGQQHAEKLLKRAIELDPESADANYMYGKALLRWDRSVEARPRLEKAHDLGNRSALPLLKSYVPPQQSQNS